MWGILSHIKYGRHRGTMVKTIVSSRGRGRSFFHPASSRAADTFFFLFRFAPLIIVARLLGISLSLSLSLSLCLSILFFAHHILLSAFQCAVKQSGVIVAQSPALSRTSILHVDA